MRGDAAPDFASLHQGYSLLDSSCRGLKTCLVDDRAIYRLDRILDTHKLVAHISGVAAITRLSNIHREVTPVIKEFVFCAFKRFDMIVHPNRLSGLTTPRA